MKLEHKRVVILGGTSGIGFATAGGGARGRRGRRRLEPQGTA
jgi:NAD(P)-dependent dehydrogenase (short-subunit alcohol dehydrogenase family)